MRSAGAAHKNQKRRGGLRLAFSRIANLISSQGLGVSSDWVIKRPGDISLLYRHFERSEKSLSFAALPCFYAPRHHF